MFVHIFSDEAIETEEFDLAKFICLVSNGAGNWLLILFLFANFSLYVISGNSHKIIEIASEKYYITCYIPKLA